MILKSEDFELSQQRKKYVKLSHINLSWKPSFKETRAILIFAHHPIINSFMSLHYICPDNLKTNLIDIPLTGTDNYNSKLSNKKYIRLLFSTFQKNLPQNYSPSVVFWKDSAFTLKVSYRVAYRKLLK